MKLNSRMKNFIDRIALDPETPVQLHPALAGLVEPGFVRLNGSIVLKALAEKAKAVTPSDFSDETGYESFVNHIHVEDHVPPEDGPASASVLLTNGISLASTLHTLLRQSFPEEGFEVILSLEDNHCTVRFHKKRTGEQWLRSDLDEYQEEALMVFQA